MSTKHLEKSQKTVVAVITQPAKDESFNVPDKKNGSELGPASEINMDISTDKETDRVRRKEEKNKDIDEKETRSNSSESVNDAPDDENFKGGTEKSTKLESVGYTEIKGGEKSKHNTFNGLVGEICEKTHHKKSTLNPHMQEMSKMKDSIQKETSSDKFTPDVPERIGSDKGNGKGKADSDTSTGKDSANDIHKDENHIEDTMKVAMSESGENLETKGGEGNDLDTFDEPVDETCEEILQEKSNLNLHMQEMSDMSDCS